MGIAVHLLQPPDPALLEVLRTCLIPAVQLSLGPDKPDPAEYHILVAGRPRREDLTASAKLHTLIIPWSGLPEETRELVQAFPQLAVHNLHHNAAPVAELAVALLLAAAKFVVPLDRALRHHDWTPRYEPSRAMLLQGKTALILGYGAIGRRAGRLCRTLGMDVLAMRRNVSEADGDVAHEIHPPQALPQLLPRAHALIVCLPLTPQTEGLLGRRELNLLPPEAVLVNVGRGKIVDQAAAQGVVERGLVHDFAPADVDQHRFWRQQV